MATLVPLTELAERVGGSLDGALEMVEKANGTVRPDWAGRLAVPDRVAAEIVDAFDRIRTAVDEEDRAEAQLKAAYREYERAHAEARRLVGETAYVEAYHEARRREMAADADGFAAFSYSSAVTGSPQAHSAAREARDAAWAKWDKRHPLLDVERFRRKGSNL